MTALSKRAFRDEEISLLGLGCMRFPTIKVGSEEIDEEKALQIVDDAYQHGVNYFDTAHGYHAGLSEPFMGKALKRYPRESFYLATKMPPWDLRTPEDVRNIFESQLQRCQVDYFDFYLFHAQNKEMFKRCVELDVYGYLQKMREQGKIRYLGFSFHDTPSVLRQILDTYEWDFVQIQLNYLDWELQDAKGQYELLAQRGIPAIIMEPVRGGALADLGEKANAVLKQAAPGRSIASWAIRYAAQLPNVLTVLSGMSNLEQLSDNIGTLSPLEPFSGEEKKALETALDLYRKKDMVPCTGCRYCMDCSFGVDIPKLFGIYNRYVFSRDAGSFREEIAGCITGELPGSCQKCGACMEHCPQHIDIPGTLDKMRELIGKLA